MQKNTPEAFISGNELSTFIMERVDRTTAESSRNPGIREGRGINCASFGFESGIFTPSLPSGKGSGSKCVCSRECKVCCAGEIRTTKTAAKAERKENELEYFARAELAVTCPTWRNSTIKPEGQNISY